MTHLRWLLLAQACLLTASVSAAPDPALVGDADSFGRNVIYLGVASTPSITLKTNCAIGPPPAPNRCVTLSAQPALTTFTENKLDTIELPAKSTNSLLCFSVTPSVAFLFHNQTGIAQPMAKFGARATVVIENDLLNDPALIDPTTGQPFNGRINLSVATYSEFRNMAVGEREYKQLFLSRACIEGISRSALMQAYGLPAQAADNFFSYPIKLTFGAAGEAQLVDNAGYYFGVRVYGDRP